MAEFNASHNYNGAGANQYFINNPSDASEEWERCLQAFKAKCPDPVFVKNELLHKYGKLEWNAWAWILDVRTFEEWRDGDTIAALWIEGNAGQGKTMMTLGLIDHLRREGASVVVSYFFCIYKDRELRTATSIIKGLITCLVAQSKSLRKHLLRYQKTVCKTFDDNQKALEVLWGVLMAMLNDSDLPTTYLIVDALDECDPAEVSVLLEKIHHVGFTQPSRIKWFFTSRPLGKNGQWLHAGCSEQRKINLADHKSSVSRAVNNFIHARVEQMARLNAYGSETALCQQIEFTLQEKSQQTFLWVAIVCNALRDVEASSALSTLEDSPAGLDDLFSEILQRISDTGGKQAELCTNLLYNLPIAHRPLRFREALDISGISKQEYATGESRALLLAPCRSLLTYSEKHDTIEFVHLSAQEYFSSRQDFDAQELQRKRFFENCISFMSKNLKRVARNWIGQPWSDPTEYLDTLDYPCYTWVSHLVQIDTPDVLLAPNGVVDKFLREHLLHWLEVMCMRESRSPFWRPLSWASGDLRQLRDILKGGPEALNNKAFDEFIADAIQFLIRNEGALLYRIAPEEIYASALLLTPRNGPVRSTFRHLLPGNTPESAFSDIPTIVMPESTLMPETTLFHIHNVKVVASGMSADRKLVTILWKCQAGLLATPKFRVGIWNMEEWHWQHLADPDSSSSTGPIILSVPSTSSAVRLLSLQGKKHIYAEQGTGSSSTNDIPTAFPWVRNEIGRLNPCTACFDLKTILQGYAYLIETHGQSIRVSAKPRLSLQDKLDIFLVVHHISRVCSVFPMPILLFLVFPHLYRRFLPCSQFFRNFSRYLRLLCMHILAIEIAALCIHCNKTPGVVEGR